MDSQQVEASQISIPNVSDTRFNYSGSIIKVQVMTNKTAMIYVMILLSALMLRKSI